MPNYYARLVRKKELRQYTSNAPALLNSTLCSIMAVFQISLQVWSVPVVLVAYCIYDSVRGCQPIMVFHHMFTLLLLHLSTLNGYAENVAPYILFSELSTVPLCALCMMRGTRNCPRTISIEWEQNWVRALKEVFLVFFMGVRIIIPIMPLVYLYQNFIKGFFVLIPLVALNHFWFFKILSSSFLIN
jgi:hypothetical protein